MIRPRLTGLTILMPRKDRQPLFLVRTWAGSYVELGRLHLVALGWLRFLLRKWGIDA